MHKKVPTKLIKFENKLHVKNYSKIDCMNGIEITQRILQNLLKLNGSLGSELPKRGVYQMLQNDLMNLSKGMAQI